MQVEPVVHSLPSLSPSLALSLCLSLFLAASSLSSKFPRAYSSALFTFCYLVTLICCLIILGSIKPDWYTRMAREINKSDLFMDFEDFIKGIEGLHVTMTAKLGLQLKFINGFDQQQSVQKF